MVIVTCDHWRSSVELSQSCMFDLSSTSIEESKGEGTKILTRRKWRQRQSTWEVQGLWPPSEAMVALRRTRAIVVVEQGLVLCGRDGARFRSERLLWMENMMEM